jgi:hypothetical protein
MTRKGKIARLPLSIRRQLNQRLQDGQKGRHLVRWLNGLPEVQAVMAAEFHGQPIAEYNLSRWKSGGYQSWEDEQNTREAAAAMIEESSGLKGLGKNDLSNRMALIFTARLVVELRRLDSIREGPRKSRMQRNLLDRFVVLRRGDLEGERIRLEQARIDFRRERFQTENEKELFHIADAPLAQASPS